MTRAAVALALAALLLPASSVARHPLRDRVAGPPQPCLAILGGTGPGIFVLDRASIGVNHGGRLWRNVPIGRCSLRPLDTVIVEAFGSQLCRNDRFRTVSPQQSIPSASCRLGHWVPYVKVK